ncbi:MAG: M23 family metallopeptidase [Rickettsiales bacterium]|nr:M23 family metallopeptidase [Rickettsiales bacterium]
MSFFLKVFLSFVVIFVSVSCSQKPAQISNRSKNIYNKNNSAATATKYRETSVSQSRAPLKNNQIEVVSGDTIFGISKKTGVPLRDLIKQNNLTPPYNLEVGDRLSIPSANYHEVKQGETLYAISRTYNMKINQLIEINELKEPYSVKAGDRIKISKENKEQQPSRNLKPSQKPAEAEQKVGVVDKVLDKFNKFSWPLRGTIISKFGPKSGGLYNDGINIKAKEGAEVKASEDGIVAYVGNELKGYGNLVIVKHSGGWITAYAHLSKASVTRGAKVKKGQKIGAVGATGNVTSPQLYFGLRKGRDAVNPLNYLK